MQIPPESYAFELSEKYFTDQEFTALFNKSRNFSISIGVQVIFKGILSPQWHKKMMRK
jgi:hypothetical protein